MLDTHQTHTVFRGGIMERSERILTLRRKMNSAKNNYIATGNPFWLRRFYKIFKFLVNKGM